MKSSPAESAEGYVEEQMKDIKDVGDWYREQEQLGNSYCLGGYLDDPDNDAITI